MKIEIIEEAESDLVEGFAFYERQSKGLGDYFLDSIPGEIIKATHSWCFKSQLSKTQE